MFNDHRRTSKVDWMRDSRSECVATECNMRKEPCLCRTCLG